MDGTIILCENFASSKNNDNDIMVIGKKFLYREEFLSSSFPLSSLNCYYIYGLSSLKCWFVNDIKQKYVALPFKNGYVTFPLLHS